MWAPKPRQLTPYTAPQRPWITLAEVKRTHAGDPNWRALLVDDGRLMAEYVSAAPGTTVGRRFHPDTREWFAVVEGEVRVEIEGQAPFTATRGSLGQHSTADALLGGKTDLTSDTALKFQGSLGF